MSSISIWHVTQQSNQPVSLQDLSSLDAVTRQLPDGYYSTFRTFDQCRRVLGLRAHLRRLYGPVSSPEVSAPLLRRELYSLLEPYRPGEARVRLIMTRQGALYAALEALKPLSREVYEKGVRAETTSLQRFQPRLKSTSFIGRSDSERKHIAREGIFEALLVKDEKILEGMTSNFFYVVGRDTLRVRCGILPYIGTARNDILLGVTRKTVIDIARGRGVEVKYQPLKRDQRAAASEAFITSSSRGIVPVIQIDEAMIGPGTPGPITKELMTAYEAYVMEKGERIWNPVSR